MAALAARNAVLGALTLTLYRFWARTSMRRRIWARTTVLDDPLEYAGSGGELVRGFLISLPTFFLPALFAVNLAPLAFDAPTAGLIAFVFYCAAVPLIAAGRYWMRRYQLSRTRWRGIRFALDGSAWGYAIASAVWTVMQIVTLGWFTPAARLKRAGIVWGNTRFGDLPFGFDEAQEGRLRGLYGPFAIGWIGSPFCFALGGFLGALSGGVVVGALGSGEIGDVFGMRALPPLAYVALSVWAAAWAILFGSLAWTPYRAAMMRKIASLVSIDGARFALNVSAGGLAGVTLLGGLILIFSLGFLAPLAGAIYMRHVLNRLTLVDQPRFAEIYQMVVAAPESAEGTADAFDLDFGVGIV